MWRGLPEETKTLWKSKGEKLKVAYREKLAEYKESAEYATFLAAVEAHKNKLKEGKVFVWGTREVLEQQNFLTERQERWFFTPFFSSGGPRIPLLFWEEAQEKEYAKQAALKKRRKSKKQKVVKRQIESDSDSSDSESHHKMIYKANFK